MLDTLALMLASAPAPAGVEGWLAGLFTLENGLALLTLTALEIVLGIDNVVFLAILTSKLPEHQQAKARRIGLLLAMGMRIVLLFAIAWIMKLTAPFFTLPFGFLGEHEVNGEMVAGLGISGRDVILIVGGLFLIAKATYEIHHKLEEPPADALHPTKKKAAATFGGVLIQVMLIDAVFSLDSVITAVGMADEIAVMVTAVVIAIIVMMVFAEAISSYIEKHPTLKMLALAFLVLIGVLLVADGFHQHIPRGYVYFAMAFSLGVEMLNIRAIRMRKKRPPATAGPG